MTPEMRTVLWITAVGAAVLFASIGGLVGLMYILTASWLFPKDERVAMRERRRVRRSRFRRSGKRESDMITEVQVAPDVDAIEHERRLKAVALAAAIASAETVEMAWLPSLTVSSDWTVLHRAHRLGLQPPRRRGTR